MKEGHGGPMDEDLKRKVDRHDNDLYYGNGKPGLTIRMALAEKSIDDNKESSEKEIAAVQDQVSEIVRDGKATRKMVLGAIITLLVEIAVRVIFK